MPQQSQSSSMRAEFYRGAALHALHEARQFRDLSRTTRAAIDRHLMRSFARQWRLYTARARSAESLSHA